MCAMAQHAKNETAKRRNAKRERSSVCLDREKGQEEEEEEEEEGRERPGREAPVERKATQEMARSRDRSGNFGGPRRNLNYNFDQVYGRNKSLGNAKSKNNFTIRDYQKKRHDNRKRNPFEGDHPEQFQTQIDHDRNGNAKFGRTIGSTDSYLEKGTYEVAPKLADPIDAPFSEEDDVYSSRGTSLMSDYSDQSKGERCDEFNYYLHFGDPYVMNNGEIAVSEDNNYYDRYPNYEQRVFYYGSQPNQAPPDPPAGYDPPSATRYQCCPTYPDPKYRSMEPYLMCVPRVFVDDCMMTAYNGFVNIDQGLGVDVDYYPPYPAAVPNTQDFLQDRYLKPVCYEEPDETYPSHYPPPHPPPDSDTLNVINLNSSLFVYNSNVHINTVHNEIYGCNANPTNNCESDEMSSEVQAVDCEKQPA